MQPVLIDRPGRVSNVVHVVENLRDRARSLDVAQRYGGQVGLVAAE